MPWPAQGADTPVWLATSTDHHAGRYLKHRRTLTPNPAARAEARQNTLITRLAEITGEPLPPQ